MRKGKKKVQKGKNQRERKQYPALERGVNLKSRRDYIEAEYIKGVKNSKDELVIRPLTDDEKAWLNNFYEESVVTNFLHDPILRRLNNRKKSLVNDETVIQLRKQAKELEKLNTPESRKRARELKQIIKLTKEQNRETYAKQIEKIEKQLQERREEVLLYPDKEDHKKFYNENNSRNQCAFNVGFVNSIDDMDIENENNTCFQVESWEEDLVEEMEWERTEEELYRLAEVLKKTK